MDWVQTGEGVVNCMSSLVGLLKLEKALRGFMRQAAPRPLRRTAGLSAGWDRFWSTLCQSFLGGMARDGGGCR